MKIYGLNYKPDLGNKKINNRDAPIVKRKMKQEFSECNHAVLKEVILSIKNKCKTILEIGVARNDIKSSTYTLLNNKNDKCFYFGVDLNDKSFLDDKNKNIYTTKTSSSETDKIIDFIKEKTNRKTVKFDLIHIDGWHSVNQILDDWKFVKLLSKNGLVVLHDTNFHPGPSELIKAIDTEKFEVDRRCINEKDWGITIVKRK